MVLLGRWASVVLVSVLATAGMAAEDLGTGRVRVEPWGDQQQDNAKAGLYPAIEWPGAIVGVYARAALGEVPRGWCVVGTPGVLYPSKTAFEVAELTRDQQTIRIAIRHRPADKAAGPSARPGEMVQVFCSAALDGLPPGKYKVELVMVQDGPAGREVTTGPVTCELTLPPERLDKLDLKTLSDEQLLAEYIQRGTRLKGKSVGPRDSEDISLAAIELTSPDRGLWEVTRQEILQRGQALAPALLALLEKQMALTTGGGGDQFGFTRDLMELLAKSGDPRSAPLLVSVLEGYNGKATRAQRQTALTALRRITGVSFSRYAPHWGGYAEGVCHASAKWAEGNMDARRPMEGRAQMLDREAKAYRQWLAAEGKDPGQWQALMDRRVAEILNGDDLDLIYCTVSFLQAGQSRLARDGDPQRTAARLARVIAEAKRTGEEGSYPIYEWRGQRIKPTIWNWASQLAECGGDARPFCQVLITLTRQSEANWAHFMWLRMVGGKDVVTFCVEQLPGLDAKARAEAKTEAAAEGKPAGKRPEQDRMAYESCRWAIERLVGRTFDSDAELYEWWKQNQGLTEQQWLEQSLEGTAQKADGGDARGQYLFRALAPDLPEATELRWDPPGQRRFGGEHRLPTPLDRGRWLREMRERLRFDERTLTFRVAGG